MSLETLNCFCEATLGGIEGSKLFTPKQIRNEFWKYTSQV